MRIEGSLMLKLKVAQSSLNRTKSLLSEMMQSNLAVSNYLLKGSEQDRRCSSVHSTTVKPTAPPRASSNTQLWKHKSFNTFKY